MRGNLSISFRQVLTCERPGESHEGVRGKKIIALPYSGRVIDWMGLGCNMSYWHSRDA